MKIMVTGATGFVGRFVVEELLRKGHQVVATSAHAERAAIEPWFSRVTYIPFDLSQFDAQVDYFTLFGKPDALIHLAWEGLPNYKEPFHLAENLPRHATFLKSLIGSGLPDLTVTGTCLEYGMREGALDEELLPSPGNPYAEAKDKLRILLDAVRKENPFTFRWVRLFYMYGRGQNPKSLLSQLDKALDENATSFNMSGGEQLRDYLPVEKVAEYLVRIATQRRVTGIINCCSGKPISVKAFVLEYLKRIKRNIPLNLGYFPYVDYEPMRFWGNDTKLKTILRDE